MWFVRKLRYYGKPPNFTVVEAIVTKVNDGIFMSIDGRGVTTAHLVRWKHHLNYEGIWAFPDYWTAYGHMLRIQNHMLRIERRAK